MEFEKINLEVIKKEPLQILFIFKRNGQTYATLGFNFPNKLERQKVWENLKNIMEWMDRHHFKEW